jgi:hypothetical protein
MTWVLVLVLETEPSGGGDHGRRPALYCSDAFAAEYDLRPLYSHRERVLLRMGP